MDDVRNESEVYNTQAITFDTTAPTISSAYLYDRDTSSHTYTNDKTGVGIHVESSDAGSGLSKIILKGTDLKGSPVEITTSNATYDGTFDFIDAVVDGVKTITIEVYDAAGNYSTQDVSITLDTTLSKPILSLLTLDEESLPAWINYHVIKVQVTFSDSDIYAYKI